MEQKGKELKVSAIENGTVLDHIPATQLFKVINILDLSHCQHPITFGTNLDSKLLGKKAIIKIFKFDHAGVTFNHNGLGCAGAEEIHLGDWQAKYGTCMKGKL